MTALDWTGFDDDPSATVPSMIASHGRATPLLWKMVMRSELKGLRNEHEDASRRREVTVLANRGFGDEALCELLKEQLGLDFVVRFRGRDLRNPPAGAPRVARRALREACARGEGRAHRLRGEPQGCLAEGGAHVLIIARAKYPTVDLTVRDRDHAAGTADRDHAGASHLFGLQEDRRGLARGAHTPPAGASCIPAGACVTLKLGARAW